MADVHNTIIIPPPSPSGEDGEKRACVVIISGTPIGKVFFLSDSDTIGRAEDVSISIEDASISRHHAKISKHDKGWVLEDLKSMNGTFVNFEPVASRTLNGGEIITTGATTLKFLVASKMEGNFYELIFQMTSRDALTHAFTKTFFLEVAAHEFTRAVRYRRSLSFCIMDLDHFKQFNDTHGHAAGDYVLKEWAMLVTDNIRTTDVFGRLGGEEFGLILPEQDELQTEMAISRLLAKTRGHSFYFNKTPTPVTFSAGLACVCNTDEEFQVLFNRADRKLYEAKTAGRNTYRS